MSGFDPIAIVGMGGVFPDAPNLNHFWRNIVDGRCSIKPAPPERWAIDPQKALDASAKIDHVYSTNACFVDDFDLDAREFKIDPTELSTLDPVCRLTLEASRQALFTCGSDRLDPSRVGVFLAAIALPTDGASAVTGALMDRVFERQLFGSTAPLSIDDPVLSPGRSRVTYYPAAITARAFGLTGGAMTLDAACASSLYAIKIGCDELHSGRLDAVLAGGVSRPDSLFTQMGFSQLRALSKSGRCRPFDQHADGLVVGEGAGVVVLKRLSDAVRAGDSIVAVIRGIGWSNDTAGSLLAADAEGQLRAMQAAYDVAGWRPDQVDLIECHGTGTPLGDATELRGLRQLWGDDGWRAAQCAIGSVKSNIGHLLTAAGAAGLIKTLMAMQNQTLPPSLGFDQADSKSGLANSPFHIQVDSNPWTTGGEDVPRRAAVSGFGFGGINAHVLLEQWIPNAQNANARSSAPSPEKISTGASEVRDEPVAIVGMDARFGELESLRAFQEAFLNGRSVAFKRSAERWSGWEQAIQWDDDHLPKDGAYLSQVDVTPGSMRLPPNEIPEVLAQQLIAFKSVKAAIDDADWHYQDDAERTGVFVGIEFDWNTTNFHHRWKLADRAIEWAKRVGWRPQGDELDRWLDTLRDASGPPLTAGRVQGALGNIVASRIAREFGFGGPSFAISADVLSGFWALRIAINALSRGEIDAAIVSAVDLPGDLRSVLTRANGDSPGNTRMAEGAATLILRRKNDAERQGVRSYGVVRGVGLTGPAGDSANADNHSRSIEQACKHADVAPESLTQVVTSVNASDQWRQAEVGAVQAVFGDASGAGCALSSVVSILGDAGAAGGLASVVASALCLHQRILPPMSDAERWSDRMSGASRLHAPRQPQYWLSDQADGPRRSGVCASSADGSFGFVVIEEAAKQSAIPSIELRQPLGLQDIAVFGVAGADVAAIRKGLGELKRSVNEKGDAIEAMARRWFSTDGINYRHGKQALAIVARGRNELLSAIDTAAEHLNGRGDKAIDGRDGVYFTPSPLGNSGKTAFVFPGSGNHFTSMGSCLSVRWPEVLREVEGSTDYLRSQMRPERFAPLRLDWSSGWESEVRKAQASDPAGLILAQVSCSVLSSDILRHMGVRCDAVIGYSLGETASLFACRAWCDRDEMWRRMEASTLFHNDLVGPCDAARRFWKMDSNEAVDWCVMAVSAPADAVREVIDGNRFVFLLIVNTPAECVIGGRRADVQQCVTRLRCSAIDIVGASTVHCPIVGEVEQAYRSLHLMPTDPPTGIHVYSAARALKYDVTKESAADSILQQALGGFDFTRLIEQAYADGVRVFVETGPQASCSRMIGQILKDKPHVAMSALVEGVDEVESMLQVMGQLLVHRAVENLSGLYAEPTVAVLEASRKIDASDVRAISVPTNLPPVSVTFPPHTSALESKPHADEVPVVAETGRMDRKPPIEIEQPTSKARERVNQPIVFASSSLPAVMAQSGQANASAHDAFLRFSQTATRGLGQGLTLQAELLKHVAPRARDRQDQNSAPQSPPPRIQNGHRHDDSQVVQAEPSSSNPNADRENTDEQNIAFDRDKCMEFAIGSLAKVLGPRFAEVDDYPVRVRLPDEPLMLVDRIISVEGEMGSLGSGRIVTEHDVLDRGWYLDGGRAPVCITVEAGQADLFLCSYLGIDLAVRGARSYRLLDAKIVFHRDLPQPGEVIRYDIHIDRFVRQGETYMFFFRYRATIDGAPLLTMTDGCAGFFTEQEIAESGGIVTLPEDRDDIGERCDPLVAMRRESFSSDQVNALRRGDLVPCFGEAFTGVVVPEWQRIGDGRMNLAHRVSVLDPDGGQFGRGVIRAEADIHSDDWFLTCHFVDDMVMPGTLMYECCAHTLRVFAMRMGWVSDDPTVRWAPLLEQPCQLRCRGPVTPQTRIAAYELHVKSVSLADEPTIIADAHMYADDRKVVLVKDLSLRMVGANREKLERIWSDRRRDTHVIKPVGEQHVEAQAKSPIFDRDRILAYAEGKPSDAFGEEYRVFDAERRLARLPRPPYSFLDRITEIHAQPWKTAPGGWIEGQYDIPADAWYFAANRQQSMPFAVLVETALQPCGWLAAYVGSALNSDVDLSFRNLDGSAILHEEVFADSGMLTTRVRLTHVSHAGGMIIEKFDMQVWCGGRIVYDGDTAFGFFSKEALAQQIGVRDASDRVYTPNDLELDRSVSIDVPRLAPLTLDDFSRESHLPLSLPGRALMMLDSVDCFVSDGGPAGLGFIRGSKEVDPDEWFFRAHFYQDPVCPGSLGLESFIQLLKIVARHRWGDALEHTHRFEPIAVGQRHRWTYRGQIVPTNGMVTVEAMVTQIEEGPSPKIVANGFLKVDGVIIYEMTDFALRLTPTS